MKVILKTTVVDRILESLSAARRDRREPDCIVVTHEEYAELRKDMRGDYVLQSRLAACLTRSDPPTYDPIPVRYFERINHYCYPDARRCIAAVSDYTFHGIPLYVIPKEYHPQ
ncbi:hypothetical protein AVU43_gp21 [Ralstonia phage RSJ5]|uniref:Uncharacterized protein n=1 Tax=Ralstonia phage RSJ5 TaxID=1538364 RepID=A0A077KRX3_9CAUD|nr:hypothetical protein AVU43_gp21 [Ralstonia phage RSJ5]BAP34915.1 hypothetical protein [Ralstonia phage RSJ5]